MTGGLIQLVAYGTQDLILTGEPEITYFKGIYKRHTNFSLESIMQQFNMEGNWGKLISANISKSADLLYTTDLRIVLPAVPAANSEPFRWLNWLGHILVEYVEVEIGGQRIDRHYGHWLHIWNELTQTGGHQAGYARLVGNVPRLVQSTTGDVPSVTLYIPLQFWFNRNVGLALPLIALQSHDVRINVKLADLEKCYWNPGGSRTPTDIVAVELWTEYVHLDRDERKIFAQAPHEYLIEQVQFNGAQTFNGPQLSWNYQMAFNHPVKEIIWTVQKDSIVDNAAMANYGGPQWFNYSDALDYTYFSGTPQDPLGGGIGTAAFGGANWPHSMPYSGTAATSNIVTGFGNISGLHFNDLFGVGPSDNDCRGLSAKLPIFDNGDNPIKLAKIQLNGVDRFKEREGLYFNTLQTYYRHRCCPAIGINVYSMSLTPEDHQPSGTCNFTKLDVAKLQFTLTDNSMLTVDQAMDSVKLRVYGVNYNVLRVMSGMAAIAFNR